MSERDQSKPDDAKVQPVQPVLSSEIPDPKPPSGAGLDSELQAFIGRQLQSSFDSVLNEPVPDRFVELLKALEQNRADET